MDADLAAGRERSGGRDRLSRLGDGTLGHILSFLPAVEAARAAALSRRWRHVFPAVHSLNFRESEGPLSMRGYHWFRLCDYCRPGDPDNVRAPRFVTGVGAALHGRDRGPRFAAAAAPLRALRVAFDEFGFQGGDAKNAVDGWLSYAVYHAGDALEINLRLDGVVPVCERKYTLLPPVAEVKDAGGEQEFVTDVIHDSGGGGGEQEFVADMMDAEHEAAEVEHPVSPMDGHYMEFLSPTEYVTPRSLFSCAALRTLRLGDCWLSLPSVIALPSLATLHLTRITGRQDAIQKLVTACPRLADLTLESFGNNLTQLAVLGKQRLRRLALRCCHGLAAVAVDSSELRAFEYRGAVPAGPRFLTMRGPRSKISLCTVDLCGQELTVTPELGNLVHFLRLFAGVERLHLTSARLGSGIGHQAFSSSALEFPAFPALRNLELTGMLPGDDTTAITAVSRILERTPSVETLSLFFLPEPHPVVTNPYLNDHVREEVIHAVHKLRYDWHAALAVPGMDIPCLRERVREINFVHYQGAMAQRMLAKFLLGNAPVVDEVCCEFARGPLSIQTKLMEEMKGWVLNKSANMIFL